MRQHPLIERNLLKTGTALLILLRPSEIHQNAAHEPCGHSVEVCATLPGDLLYVDEAHVGFVHQGCGLEGMPYPFAPHEVASNSPQLVVHQRRELFEGSLVAFSPGNQQPSHIRVLENVAHLGLA